MKTRKVISLSFLVLLALTTSLGAFTNASIAYPLSPEQMFTNSDLVVTGTVSEVYTRWGQGNESIIITVVRLGVDGIAKGEQHSPIIDVNIPGGKVGELGVWVEDQPTFTVGEHVLLYLKSRSSPLNSEPRYTLTGGTFFGKSYASGNTTIGADGERVPIVIVASAPWDITETASDTIYAAGPLWDDLIVPADVYPSGETAYVNVTVVGRMMRGEPPYATGLQYYPIMVNGSSRGITVPLDLSQGGAFNVSAGIELTSPREMMWNPFTPPTNHLDYYIGVGGLQRRVTVYSYPDYTYLYSGLAALIVLTSVVFILKARRTSDPIPSDLA